MSGPTIRAIRTVVTAPRGINLAVVKVETSEPGLYGVGCATVTTRTEAVRNCVASLATFLVGKDVHRIEDIWQTAVVNSYWRGGPVLNSALSGVDEALWDIKAKLAAMPLYQLFGGRCRESVAVYRHASGADHAQLEDDVRRLMEEGYHHIRCQVGGYGGPAIDASRKVGTIPGEYFDPDEYALSVPRMLEHLRAVFGYGVELLHDVHERLSPIEAVRLARAVDPYRLFFLEDHLPPEQVDWFEMVRRHSVTPIAMGELFVNSNDWLNLVSNHLIDFIRVHISDIGGLTPARKLATLCEAFGVRTAFHGPADVSPVGHAANLHLDLAVANFGIQEWSGFTEPERAVFPGCPEVRRGYMYPNAQPGLGIDIDETEAARFPPVEGGWDWLTARLPDGSPARP
ncbi:MAG: enolase C-terminal domain-like protein [Candidatus Dormibacteria bacterium]